MKKLVQLPLLLLAACGDNGSSTNPDAPTTPPDAAIDAPDAWVAPTPVAVPLSPAGPDQLMSLASGPSGTFYAAGFAAQTVSGAKYLIVAKLKADGSLDTTFNASGTQPGVYTSTLEFKGSTDEIDIVTQSDGKIVVSATVAATLDAADRDIALFRLTTAGTLDTTFGTLGTSTFSLNTANPGSTLTAMDSARGLSVGAGDALFLHAVQRGEGNATAGGPRTDTDFAIVKLGANTGMPDLTWAGNDGKFLLDIQESNATAKGLHALSDGSVIGSGYANSPGLGTVQPVLYKLTSAGVLDTGFATQGLFHEAVLTLQTEIYSIAVDGNAITTAGYGRNTGTANDWVSMRFNTQTGARDTNFGGAANGAVLIDPSGTMLGSNCRNAIALPQGKTALIGSMGPGSMAAEARDGAIAMLTKNGMLDTMYGAGVATYKLGSDGSDQFWGGAVADGKLMVVGWKGGPTTQTDTANDDSFGVVYTLAQ